MTIEMTTPTLILLYVDNAQASADFYGSLLGLSPLEDTPAFVMFQLSSGTQLALRNRDGAQPPLVALPGATEIGFMASDRAAVDDRFEDWQRRGLSILMQPTMMPFGYTFVADDPDGHRLRVYALGVA